MDPFYSEKTRETPEIILDKAKGEFIIRGRSYPGDVETFYKPVIDWLLEYRENPNDETVFHVEPEYLNSGSSKVFANLFTILDEIIKQGNKVLVKWHYYYDDEDMEELGRDFSQMRNVSFEFIPVE
ncbi:MAG: DUF1987 domain-containing protein [bacterium]